jgi:transcriptional regulator with XRE-family HTH domain
MNNNSIYDSACFMAAKYAQLTIKFKTRLAYSLSMENMENSEKEFLKLLGNRVRDYRKSLGISQERLAELASVHPTYISNIENAKANASIGIYRRVANGLTVPIAQLLDINQPRVERDDLMKVFLEIKTLSRKEQKMVLETIKGLLTGIRE